MHLDDDALAAIRRALEATRQLGAVPRAALAELAEVLPKDMGLTIDFDAAGVLGQPLVVVRPSGAVDPCFEALTPREREVCGLLATGLRNKDIAIALSIAVGTVKDHVHNILEKTGLDSRTSVASLWRD